MLVTLNTDGSLAYARDEDGVSTGGWAYWISSDVGRFTDFGRTPNCDNAMAPELVAIAKGLNFIRNHPELSKAKKIIVNTDCIPAIDWIKSINKHRKKYEKHKGSLQNSARHHIIRMAKKGYNDLPAVKIEYRHVKAHTKDLSTARKWVNDWLDKHAKLGRTMKLKENKWNHA